MAFNVMTNIYLTISVHYIFVRSPNRGFNEME